MRINPIFLLIVVLSWHTLFCSALRELLLPYSGKFLLVQIFTEMRSNSSEEISQNECRPHPTCMQTKETTLNDGSEEASLCNNQPSLCFVWRPLQLQKYQDCRLGQETGLLHSRIQLISTQQFWSVCWHFVQ